MASPLYKTYYDPLVKTNSQTDQTNALASQDVADASYRPAVQKPLGSQSKGNSGIQTKSFWEDLSDTVSNPGDFLNHNLNNIGVIMGGNQDNGTTTQDLLDQAQAQQNQETANLTSREDLKKKMQQDIDTLKSTKGNVVKGLLQPKLRSGRDAIAEKLATLKSAYGSRGRLNSGAARKAAAEAKAQALKDMQNQEFETTSNVDSTISELEDLYQRAGMVEGGLQFDADQAAAMAAFNKKLQELNAMTGIGGAAGGLVGAGLANRGSSSGGGQT